MFPGSARDRRVIIAWSLVSGLVHLVWEGTWSVAAPYLQSHAAQHDWRLFWTLYGRADFRYVHADPFVRILELVTGTLVAALNLHAAHGVWKRRQVPRALVSLFIASVMEVYGTLLYFGSELLDRWHSVDTASVVHTWVMFFGLNALWLAFPGWCIWELVRHYSSGWRGERAPAPVVARI